MLISDFLIDRPVKLGLDIKNYSHLTVNSLELGKTIPARPGWYFYDEWLRLYGVYKTEHEAMRAFKSYKRQFEVNKRKRK